MKRKAEVERKTPPSKKSKVDTIDLVESEEDGSMKQEGKKRKSKTSAVQYVFFWLFIEKFQENGNTGGGWF